MSRVKFGVRKPRPLGLVKGESVHFDDRDSRDLACDLKTLQLRETFYFLARSHTLGDLETQAEPMSDMRETLRQAAVANVVAAVGRIENEHSAGIIGANLLGHEVTKAVSKLDLFQVSDTPPGTGMLPYLQTGSSALPFVPPVPPNTATSPSAGQSLTSERSKNVTRARTFGEPEASRQNRSQNTSLANNSSRGKPHGDTKLPSLSAPDSTAGSRKGNNSSRGQRTRVVRSHDLRTKLSDLSVSSYPLHTTVNHPSPDALSVSSRVSCQDLTPGENSSGSSLHADDSPSLAQPSMNSLDENSVKTPEKHHGKKIKKTKQLSEISKCDAVDIHEPITSYVLKGAAPVTMLAPNKDMFHATNGFKKRGLVNSSVSTMNESCDISYGNSITDTPEVTPLNYEIKNRTMYELGEGLKITSLTPIDLNSSDADLKLNVRKTFYSYGLRQTPRGVSNADVERYRHEEVVGKSRQQSLPAELLDIRHLALPSSSQNQQDSVPVFKRKKIPGAKTHRDKNNRRLFRTPSPTSQEEKSENANEEFPLVGQSLPSFPANQMPAGTFSLCDSYSFNSTDSTRVDASTQPNSKQNHKYPQQKHVNENQIVGSSTHKPNLLLNNRKVVSRFNGNRGYKVENNEKPEEFLDASKFNTVNRKSLWPRQDKPTPDEIRQEPVKSAPETSPTSNDNTDGGGTAEPLYMGFSSQASEPPAHSHNMAEENGEEIKEQGNFKVFKALDHDVYSDFQHKKYRENSKLSFNTDKPRMHYIKIKVKDDINR